ncbi:hypothetical protein [Rhizobium alvei]|uniref:J domain-containing protein n=1 Tax=Rhizobium alvei TaxID=1132659 RepID=A0ABT8YIK6_9HYPH|nr:hypothetical protein [Rhizobium alvei]MDO6963526.1 hypothetical protein [Rhizobium alvei]
MSENEEPWATLGINVTDDPKAIRKAYAVRLRQTRPDEDPDGFQRLVEARDFAIYLAQTGLLSAADDRSGEDEPTPVDQPSSETSDNGSPQPEELSGHLFSSEERQHLQAVSEPMEDGIGTEPVELIASSEQGADPEVIRLLQALDQRKPWETRRSRWQAVFDALEATPFKDADWLTSVMLNDLVDAMQRDIRPLEEGEVHFLTPAAMRERMGDYWTILEDMELRFQFLHHDRVLYERLSNDKADYLLEAMERVMPRQAVSLTLQTQETAVPDIPDTVFSAAFGSDERMAHYYRKAKMLDRFSPSFSLPALLFPIPVLFRYRLYPLAILASVLSLTIASLRFVDGVNRSFPFTPTFTILYFAVALYAAFFLRQMRISALHEVCRSELPASAGQEELLRRVRRWGQPNQMAMLGGICLLLVVGALRYLSR